MKQVQVLPVIELDLPANITLGATYDKQVFSCQHGCYLGARYQIELLIIFLDSASESVCVDIDLVTRDCDSALASHCYVELRNFVVR